MAISENYSFDPTQTAEVELSPSTPNISRRFNHLHSYRFLAASAVSLFQGKPDIDCHRAVYAEVKALPLQEPLNREFDIVENLVKLLRNREIEQPNRNSLTTYWDESVQYNSLEVFGTLIQSLDYHKASLPLTVLPPESDVEQYIETMLRKRGPVTVDQQLYELLNITDNNLIGAINLGFIVSRFIGRGLDVRAYPNIKVTDELMLQWGRTVAQFESYNGSIGDSTGDTYYFWTHLFAALFYNVYGKNRLLYQSAFANGTPIMVFVRRWIARLPTTSDHLAPSLLGRRIGLALSEPSWYIADKNND